jgi:hypothetical protein
MSDAEVVTILCERRILTSQEELKQPSLSLFPTSLGRMGWEGRMGDLALGELVAFDSTD